MQPTPGLVRCQPSSRDACAARLCDFLTGTPLPRAIDDTGTLLLAWDTADRGSGDALKSVRHSTLNWGTGQNFRLKDGQNASETPQEKTQPDAHLRSSEQRQVRRLVKRERLAFHRVAYPEVSTQRLMDVLGMKDEPACVVGL